MQSLLTMLHLRLFSYDKSVLESLLIAKRGDWIEPNSTQGWVNT